MSVCLKTDSLKDLSWQFQNTFIIKYVLKWHQTWHRQMMIRYCLYKRSDLITVVKTPFFVIDMPDCTVLSNPAQNFCHPLKSPFFKNMFIIYLLLYCLWSQEPSMNLCKYKICTNCDILEYTKILRSPWRTLGSQHLRMHPSLIQVLNNHL